MELPPGAWGGPRSEERFSIKQQFSGATVLLTGCTGYIGGLVLEQLLRTTDVARVYVLLRGKKDASPQERCDRLLQGPTFHLVRDSPALLAKVAAVAGDLGEEGLGLAAADVDALAERVHVLIHSAADIRLEAPIQETMRANYVGTQRVLALAGGLRRLRAMVHVSTAYVNINHPPGTTVHEAIYPLMHGEVEVDGAAVAQELLALPKSEADRRADFLTRHWGFPNTYCLGKHLAEQLVYRTQKATGLPIAILRPSLVTGVAGLPRPGYCGNWAGPNGMGAAVAIGFFPALSAHAVHPYSVWDAVPGDLVASAILATAAAVGSGAARAIAAATGSGAWRGAGAGGGGARGAAAAGGGKRAAAGGRGRHGRSSSFVSSAFTDDTALAPGLAPSGTASGGSSRSSGGEPACDLSPKAPAPAAVHITAAAAGGGAAAPAPPPGAPAAAAAAAVAAAAAPPPPLLIVHATTSTTYPATIYEAYNTTVDFLRAHGSPTSILVGGARFLPNMPPTWAPSPRLVEFWKAYNWVKVAVVCFLLRLFGLHKAAQKLSVGFQQWAMNNDFKNDTRLLFASPSLQQLHARIEPAERADYLLTFGPPRLGGGGGGGEGGEGGEGGDPEHPAARLGWRQYSVNCLAGIMRMLTGRNLPPSVPAPGRPGEFITHQYLHIK